jgi:hypothetical protein
MPAGIQAQGIDYETPKDLQMMCQLRGTARLKAAILETCFRHGPSYRLDNAFLFTTNNHYLPANAVQMY